MPFRIEFDHGDLRNTRSAIGRYSNDCRFPKISQGLVHHDPSRATHLIRVSRYRAWRHGSSQWVFASPKEAPNNVVCQHLTRSFPCKPSEPATSDFPRGFRKIVITINEAARVVAGRVRNGMDTPASRSARSSERSRT